jgi:hypothetical protein
MPNLIAVYITETDGEIIVRNVGPRDLAKLRMTHGFEFALIEGNIIKSMDSKQIPKPLLQAITDARKSVRAEGGD